MLHEAHLIHQTPARFRLKIPAGKGNAALFIFLQEQLGQCHLVEKIEGNPVTGSILVSHTGDMRGVIEFAKRKGLFTLVEKEMKDVARATLATYKTLDSEIKKLSGGQLDLAHTAFLTFIGAGVYQLARGRLVAPTWHNAFWYAMNVFLKAQAAKKHR